MPVTASEITRRLSGGASNATPATSLGGVKSSVAMGTSLFDEVAAAESVTGRIEYRCVYVHNASAADTLKAVVAWLSSNTANATTTLDIGLGTSAASGTEQVVGSETTAPTGVTFIAAASKANGILLGDLGPGVSRAIWLRRTVNAGAISSSDTAVLSIEGEA